MTEEFKPTNNDEDSKKNNLDLESETEEIKDGTQKEKISKPVVIRADAYKTIILYASRYANKSISPEEWKEIYGILIGKADQDLVYVERAEALTFGHATDVQLDERHYGFIEEIQEKLDKEGKEYYMVGWFHSHPGLNLFFSYIDLINQLGFQQNNNDFCGLVFDHTLLGKKKEEIQKREDGSEYKMTKYDTGFEIYRITDVNMDINDSGFDNNYHKIDYVVDGLNKYFFANVLSDLSALVTEGKPLQTAYKEEFTLDKNIQEPSSEKHIEKEDMYHKSSKYNDISNKDTLTEIPMTENIAFGVDDFFYGENEERKKQKEKRLREEAEQLIYEGNLAFKRKDAITGIEKFRHGIEKYKEIKDFERVLELLRTISQICISNNHLPIAEEFANELLKLAKRQNHLFYLGITYYIKGYMLLKKGDNEVLEEGLHNIQDAAVSFEKEGDFAGAGMCFNKIGSIYQSRLNKLENACLFYRAAIENFNNAILKTHPLRTDFWNKPEMLIQKVIELRDVVEELLPNLENVKLKNKIIKDLKNLSYNF
jgi:proteasome lid subunit RPN8/RPN11